MKGVYHSLISMSFGLAIFFPLSSVWGMANFLPNVLFLWALALVGMGSLVPDVDASDSLFFHQNEYISRFFKYFIYYPIAKIYGQKKHRGVMHSLPGLLATLGLFIGYIISIGGIVIIVGLIFLPDSLNTAISSLEGIEDKTIDILYILVFIPVTVGALGFGMFAHLWEDSTTVSGIRWMPSKDRVTKGHLRVGGTNEESAFIIYAAIGVIIALLELLFARDNLLLQLLFPIVAIVVFLLVGAIFRLSLFEKWFGKDKLIRDIQTRKKAKENAVEIEIEGIKFQIERDRIKRGLKLVTEYKNIGNLKKHTGYKIIDRGEGILDCSCKDYKNFKDLTLCKHLVAYLALKKPENEKKLQSGLHTDN